MSQKETQLLLSREYRKCFKCGGDNDRYPRYLCTHCFDEARNNSQLNRELRKKEICPRCLEHNDRFPNYLCSKCKRTSSQCKAYRISAGICFECSNPVDGNHILCAACLEKQRNAKREIRKYRKARHLCIFCGVPIEVGNKSNNLCFHCLDAARNNRRRRNHLTC
jgi:hypothetical protein